MTATRGYANLILLVATLATGSFLFVLNANAQTLTAEQLTPDSRRAFAAHQDVLTTNGRSGGYVPARTGKAAAVRPPRLTLRANAAQAANVGPLDASNASVTFGAQSLPPILAGTPLTRVLHTSQLSLISSAGSDEQFVDRDNDLKADERTTFDNAGGSFDIAVGVSGTRYEVYSATFQGANVGVLVLGLDTNGNYISDSSSTYDLHRDFSLPSAAAVVTGTSKAGGEFVIVCSSGYYNSANPNDPNNEPSPGVVLLVRSPTTGGFNTALSRSLVTVGDNKLYNANALALLPNNDLIIADFHSDELRVVRDTDGDGIPDTLATTPYYSYLYSDDAPLDIAANSRGVVFSHSVGNDMLLLAIYDDNGDGRGDHDEVAVTGLSIDDNLFLHGLTVDRLGNVYVVEDATGLADGNGGNGGIPRIDGFPDPSLDGFLHDGAIFSEVDAPDTQGLSGISLGALAWNPINDAQFFIHQHYLDFLNREPDQGGWDYWTEQVTRCGSDQLCVHNKRIDVSAAFFVELEFQRTGYVVYRIYRAAYGTLPGGATRANMTFTQFITDRAQLVDGPGLPESTTNLANNFVQRSEFKAAYPEAMTPTEFVNKLFDTAGLAGAANAPLRLQQIDAMTNSGKTRSQVLLDVIEIAELKTREYNPAFVLMQYFGYLRRNPDQGGYDFWLNVLNNQEPNNYRGMVCAFLTAREYQERFGLLLRRTNVDCQ